MKYLMVLSLALMLTACSTTKNMPTALPMKTCTPPPELMMRDDPLAPITLDDHGKITLQQLVTIWIDDIGLYNKLRNKTTTLQEYIEKHCQ